MLAHLINDEENKPPTRLRKGRHDAPTLTPTPVPTSLDKQRPEPLVIPINKLKLKSYEEKAEESCISLDEIFDMYNPSSNQNRAKYFPNDEDKEMERQIKEKKEKEERKRKRDEKRAEKAAKKAELEREKVEKAAKDAT